MILVPLSLEREGGYETLEVYSSFFYYQKKIGRCFNHIFYFKEDMLLHDDKDHYVHQQVVVLHNNFIGQLLLAL